MFWFSQQHYPKCDCIDLLHHQQKTFTFSAKPNKVLLVIITTLRVAGTFMIELHIITILEVVGTFVIEPVISLLLLYTVL